MLGSPGEAGFVCNSRMVEVPAPQGKAGVAEGHVQPSPACAFVGN